MKKFNISSDSVFHKWIKQYKEFGSIFDNRGKGTKLTISSKGRPRKHIYKPLEECSKEELIEKVRMLEDIKKSLVYLSNQSQNKNIK